MGKKFLKASPYRDVDIDETAVRYLLVNLIENGIVFCTDSGFIAGGLAPLYFAPSVQIATELAWWAEDGSGTALREAFENKARELGASASQISVLGNTRAADLTKNLSGFGYVPVEVSYLKVL